MKRYVGVDLGSSSIKMVVLDEARNVQARWLKPTSLLLERDLCELREELDKDHAELVTVSTGYGRHRVASVSMVKPEIACHAKGVHAEFNQAVTVIDIGGQDNKVISIDGSGNILRFRMNSKCAAGTGAFLEEIANKARLSMDELHDLALMATSDAPFNSFCTVFAMTELIKRVMEGETLNDLARGVYLSIAERIHEMYATSPAPVVLTGGVIHHNPILRHILADRIEDRILIPEHPQYTGALGAALYAREMCPAEVEG